MTVLNAALVAIFSIGGAAAIGALFKGMGLIRSGAARTEARAIKNLERYRDEADDRAARVSHRLDYARELTEYHRSNYADLAHYVRLNFGAEHVPPVPAPPTYQPLPRGQQLPKRTDDHE